MTSDVAEARQGGPARDSSRLGPHRHLLAAAGGLEIVRARQALGEIERVAVEIAQAVLCRGGSGEEITLCVGAAELAQLLELLPASIPSATTWMCRWRAMAMMALTIARSLRSVTRSRTKLRSILSVSTRQRLRYERLE